MMSLIHSPVVMMSLIHSPVVMLLLIHSLARVSIFPEKNFQPGTWNNPEKHPQPPEPLMEGRRTPLSEFLYLRLMTGG